tara:strand:+ start:79 stop:801 length:723 start_codon:yes stop_codon:yes gene_type:complete
MSSSLKKTKVIILCGGRGKRLGKITKSIPKPLVKVGKIPIIEHKINYYKKQGLEKFVFCTGYKSEILKKFLIKKCKNPIFYNSGINSGILKRIYLAKKSITTPVIISYGDTLAKINFKNLLYKHKKSKAVISIVVAPIKNPFGLVNWNKGGKLTKFEEKPILNHFIGYAVFEPRVFTHLNKKIINLENGKGIVTAIQKLILKRLVNVYKFNGLQLTVNSLSELKEAKKRIGKYFTFDDAF